MNDTWTDLLQPAARAPLARLLLEYVLPRRWFRAKSRTPRGAEIADLIPLDGHGDAAGGGAPAANWLALLTIAYDEWRRGSLLDSPGQGRSRAGRMFFSGRRHTRSFARLAGEGDPASEGAMVDGLALPAKRRAGCWTSSLRSARSAACTAPCGRAAFLEASGPGAGAATSERLAVRVPDVEQTNSTLMVGQHLLKIYRQVIAGPSPELEIGRFLTAHCRPPCAPRVLGALSSEKTFRRAGLERGHRARISGQRRRCLVPGQARAARLLRTSLRRALPAAPRLLPRKGLQVPRWSAGSTRWRRPWAGAPGSSIWPSPAATTATVIRSSRPSPSRPRIAWAMR